MTDHLWLALLFIQAAWAWKVKRLGLVRRYPALFTYLTLTALFALLTPGLWRLQAIAAGHLVSSLYGWYWLLAQLLTWGLYTWVLAETWWRALDGSPNARRLMTHGIVGCGGVAVLTLALVGRSWETWLQFWSVLQRDLHVALAVWALLLMALTAYHKLEAPRNVKTVFAAFTLIFLANGVFGAGWAAGVSNAVIAAVHVAALTFGAVLFSPAGETSAGTLGRSEAL